MLDLDDYILLGNSRLSELNESINEYLKKGYKLYGKPYSASISDSIRN